MKSINGGLTEHASSCEDDINTVLRGGGVQTYLSLTLFLYILKKKESNISLFYSLLSQYMYVFLPFSSSSS